MTVTNVLKDLKEPSETQVSVAKRYHISPTSVASIFDSHVEMPALPLTDRILIDEAYAFASEDSKYVLMILDDNTKEPLDILPSRRKDYLLDHFMRIPYKERLGVKYVCTDMYDVFRQVIRKAFPAACHITDHYHVSQELHRKIDRVRIRVMNHYAFLDRTAKKNKDMRKNDSSDE